MLRDYAENKLAEAFEDAAGEVAMEMGASPYRLPRQCPWTLEMLLAENLLRE